jgi:hypothetical protein
MKLTGGLKLGRTKERRIDDEGTTKDEDTFDNMRDKNGRNCCDLMGIDSEEYGLFSVPQGYACARCPSRRSGYGSAASMNETCGLVSAGSTLTGRYAETHAER